MPEDWKISTIEFTEGSSCSDNLIAELDDLAERMDAEPHSCTCGMVTREYVREATAEDEENCRLFVARLPT